MKRTIALHWKILIGLCVGVIWAILSSWISSLHISIPVFNYSIAIDPVSFTSNWIKPIGDVFIKLLKMIAIPLVLFSIIKGVSGLEDIRKIGRLGIKTLGTYIVTTILAVTTGLLLVNTIQPGQKLDAEKKLLIEEKAKEYAEHEGAWSKLEEKQKDANEMREQSPLQYITDLIIPSNVFLSLTNEKLMLQVIFFAIFFGVSLILIPKEKAEPVIRIIDGINEVIIKMIMVLMRGAPFFVFCLLAGVVAKLAGDNPALVIEIGKGLFFYALVVIVGLVFLAFFLYPLVMKIVAGISPLHFLKKISPAQALAFSTSSSAATLPVTMKCVQENLGVSEETSSFILPVGATVNMDGTSLYQAITVVFLAQFFNHDLGLAQQLTIVVTATLASIGAPAVPSAGLVMIIIVLEAIGLPAWWIALIFPIDRILDMIRTVVNVTGDAMVACVIAKTEGETLNA